MASDHRSSPVSRREVFGLGAAGGLLLLQHAVAAENLSCIKGVVILKKHPGRRKSVKYYIDQEKH